jgi:hypothetical protein
LARSLPPFQENGQRGKKEYETWKGNIIFDKMNKKNPASSPA